MNYIDGFLAPVLTDRKAEYQMHALKMAKWLKAHGALRITECWGDDVPEGKLTSFTLSVQRKDNETTVFSWIEWPSKEVRDATWQVMMEDPEMKKMMNEDMPFDGKRIVYGGFSVLVDEA